MKKFHPFRMLLSVMGTCSLLLSSCSSSDAGDTPPPALQENSFSYNNAQSKIESVIYTVEEESKVYTFYFSPTQGVIDLDAMLLADDFVKISTPTPTGVIDLLSDNNSLDYKALIASPATGDKVEKASLSLQLTSISTAKMSLDVTMKSGETLQAEYNGTCIKQAGQQTDVYDVTLNDQIFGYYMGPDTGNAGTNGYYVALTNTGFEVQGTQFNLTSEGYALVVNFYGATGETWKNMPTGSFSESGHYEDHTFDSEYSGVYYRDANGKMQLFTLLDPVKITRDETGIATVTATFLDKDYEEHTMIYNNALKISDGTLNVKLPQIERDVTIEGAFAQAVYNGDIMQNGTGLMEITIYDQKAENNEPNGHAMKIAVFGEKFLNPKVDRRLIPGTYKAATTFAQFTWMQPVEMTIMGMVIPMGTYAAYDNGTQDGEYAYAASGDIIIRQGGDKTHYTIEFELKSIAGYSIQGSYTGEIYIEDQSSDNEDDGTSSLKDDYQLNFDYLSKHGKNRADCYPQNEIWIRGLSPNMTPLSTAWEYSGREYGFQHIVIGTEIYEITDEYPLGGGWNGKGKGKLVEGDVLDIDLLVENGTETQITPGIYQITTNRYPILFYPGVCVRGYNGYYGTSMTFKTSGIGWGYPDGYFDPEYKVQNEWLNVPTIGEFASIYTGTVTVMKAEGGDNWFTFSVDGRDVLKHRITGTWTGPVYLAGSDTPVVESGTIEQAAARRHLPSFRELQARNGGKLPVFTNRQSYR